jgi:hypothetical protein
MMALIFMVITYVGRVRTSSAAKAIVDRGLYLVSAP